MDSSVKKLLPLCLLFLSASGWASLAFVTSANNGGEDPSVNTITGTGVFSVTAGNLIVCMYRGNNTGLSYTFSDGSGNTWTNITNSLNTTSSPVGVMAYTVASFSGAVDSVTVNTSGNDQYKGMICLEYSGNATSNVLDANPVYSNAAGNTCTSTSFSTVNANEVIVAFWTDNGGLTYTAGNIGATSANDRGTNGTGGNGADAKGEDLIVSATQSNITATGSVSGNGSPNCTMWVASFKAAGGVAAGAGFNKAARIELLEN